MIVSSYKLSLATPKAEERSSSAEDRDPQQWAGQEFQKQLANMVDERGQTYGRIASILETHQAYVIPPVVLANYLSEEDDPIVPSFTPAQVAGALVERSKKVMEQKEANPKFYMAIFARIYLILAYSSATSLILLKRTPRRIRTGC